MARKREYRPGGVPHGAETQKSFRAVFRTVRNGAIVPARFPRGAEGCNRRGEVSAWCGKGVLMLGNIIACAVLAAWLVAAVAFLLRKRRAAKKSGRPACAGCSGSCGCCGER
ncbi:MAG: hypothetical protein K2M90_02060 [Treponemataceae bacterium]|nr:hypothetical protein [Treponemataceae bacterium]